MNQPFKSLEEAQQQAYQWLIQGRYAEATQLYEQVLEADPAAMQCYWHLGLLLLLQAQQEDAQATWLLAMAEGDADQIEAWTLDLLQVLRTEAERQECMGDYATAWIVRQHMREIYPADVENVLRLVQGAIALRSLTDKDLADWDVAPVLQSTPTADIDGDLLLQAVEQLLYYQPPEQHAMQVVAACFPHVAQHPDRFITILIQTSSKVTHADRAPEAALRLAELGLRLRPDHLELLRHLTSLYPNVGAFDQAIATARRCYALSLTTFDQAVANHLLLRSLLAPGSHWPEALTAFQHQLNLLTALVDQPPSLDRDATLWLFSSTFFQPYFRDDLAQNRQMQNQIAQIGQANVQRYGAEASARYRQRHSQPQAQATQRLKIGYVSSCLKRHSVGWLARWLIQHHDRSQVKIHIYFVGQTNDSLQEWFAGQADVAHYLSVDGLAIAEQIYQDQIDILVDLDSITLPTTCEVMALKPAPVQVTWLGWDGSGVPGIDYFIADPYVLPDTADTHYRETIWRLPQTYIAVDGFEVGVPTLRREQLNIPADAVVYLSAQRGYKRHPDTVRLQIQILKAVPNSYFLIKGSADQVSLQQFFLRLAEESGVGGDRLRFLPDDPLEAVHRANLAIADVVLDTYPYNGATTTLETLWMGIPLVTLAGEHFSSRNSYTMMINAGIQAGIAWSAADYVKWGIRLGQDADLRQQIGWTLRQSRQTAPLWNARQFTRSLETAYQHMWQQHMDNQPLAQTPKPSAQLSPATSTGTPLKLHIGGKEPHPDWKILDIEARPEVDFVGDAASLSQFADGSVAAIYASHVLEHFYYGLNNELILTLTEWHRVLQPGGKLYISVPDLRTLCWLYLNPNLMPLERHHLMRIMFGGQVNEFDVHKVGFDFEVLGLYLQEAGFEQYEQISEFGLFQDCSSMQMLDTAISLNVIVTK